MRRLVRCPPCPQHTSNRWPIWRKPSQRCCGPHGEIEAGRTGRSVSWRDTVEDSHDSALHSAGLQELTARILVYLQAAIGRALPPTAVTLDGGRLLSDAAFGVFDKWRDLDWQKISDAVGRIVDRTLGSVIDVRRVSTGSREIDLPDLDKKEEVIARIEHASPADPSTSLQATAEEPPTLFDQNWRPTSKAWSSCETRPNATPQATYLPSHSLWLSNHPCLSAQFSSNSPIRSPFKDCLAMPPRAERSREFRERPYRVLRSISALPARPSRMGLSFQQSCENLRVPTS